MKLNLTVTEASKAYGMSVAWFNRERWKGTGPRFLKMEGKAGRVLYPVEELEKFFASRLRRSTSDHGPTQKTATETRQAANVRHIGKGKESTSAGLSSSEKGQGGDEQ